MYTIYMETTNNHHHRYAFHLNAIVTILALALIVFGLYVSVSSQTGGDPYGSYDPGVVNSSQYGVPNTGVIPANYSGYGYNTYNNTQNFGQPVSNATGSGAWWGTGNADRTGTGTNTGGYGNSGTTTAGTATGGNYYYNTTGGYYPGSGLIESGPNATQGGYINSSGQAVYNNNGLVEAGATLNQGGYVTSSGSATFENRYINESMAAPTQQNTLSYKHCEFITKYHKFGDRGGDVPKIQQFLKDRGYYSGRIDGVYGISTFRAVRSFQQDYKKEILDPWEFDNKSATEGTGITNVSTRYAINKLVGCPDPATIVPKTGRVLNY